MSAISRERWASLPGGARRQAKARVGLAAGKSTVCNAAGKTVAGKTLAAGKTVVGKAVAGKAPAGGKTHVAGKAHAVGRAVTGKTAASKVPAGRAAGKAVVGNAPVDKTVAGKVAGRAVAGCYLPWATETIRSPRPKRTGKKRKRRFRAQLRQMGPNPTALLRAGAAWRLLPQIVPALTAL
jgi:hypothetical protein